MGGPNGAGKPLFRYPNHAQRIIAIGTSEFEYVRIRIVFVFGCKVIGSFQVLSLDSNNSPASRYHNFSVLPHQYIRNRTGNGPFVVLELTDSRSATDPYLSWIGEVPKKWCSLEVSLSSSREFCDDIGARCKAVESNSRYDLSLTVLAMQIRRPRALRHRNHHPCPSARFGRRRYRRRRRRRQHWQKRQPLRRRCLHATARRAAGRLPAAAGREQCGIRRRRTCRRRRNSRRAAAASTARRRRALKFRLGVRAAGRRRLATCRPLCRRATRHAAAAAAAAGRRRHRIILTAAAALR
jgi:hypothetical protein